MVYEKVDDGWFFSADTKYLQLFVGSSFGLILSRKTRAVLGFRGFGFRGVWNMLLFGMVVLDMSWLVFMYAV